MPSSAARHPMEARLIFRSVDGIPDEAWLYDAVTRQLIRDESPLFSSLMGNIPHLPSDGNS